MKQEIRRIKPWIRWTAALLALALIFIIGAQSWTAVTISVQENNAAQNYLAEQTDYVNASQVQRLRTKLQTLTQPVILEDYYRLAETHIAAEEYEEALVCIGQCLELYRSEYGESLQADLLLKKGCLLTILGRADEAETAMEQVVKLVPDLADAYLVLAQLHAAGGEIQALAADLESYLDLQTDAADMRLLLAQIYLAQGQTDAALEHAVLLYDNGGAPDTDVAGLFTGLGLSRLQMEDVAGAFELFTTALSLDDTVDSLCYYAGLCCLLLERYDEAVDYYSRSIQQQSSVQMSSYGRGAAELMRNEPNMEQAAEDLIFAAEYDGADADPTINSQAKNLLNTLTQSNETTE